jgi:hypothetical protein
VRGTGKSIGHGSGDPRARRTAGAEDLDAGKTPNLISGALLMISAWLFG